MHTPGPWRVGGKYTHKSVLLNARGESIASGGNNRSVQGQELEDSLRLAAAAPELLAALAELLAAYRYVVKLYDPNTDDAYSVRARAAIAKAQG
jgi:hypothetical protein